MKAREYTARARIAELRRQLGGDFVLADGLDELVELPVAGDRDGRDVVSTVRGEIGSIADRTCGCTDDRACYPTCSWAQDPLGMGDLCSRCLAIAASVTDVDLAEVGEFPMRHVVYADEHGAGILWPVVGLLLAGLSGAVMGLIIGWGAGWAAGRIL